MEKRGRGEKGGWGELLTNYPVTLFPAVGPDSFWCYLFVFPDGVTLSMFFTLLTPSTDLAIVAARALCGAVATVPVSVTTSLSTSTLIVESLRSSAAANSNLVLAHSQPSLSPLPILRPKSFASRA